MTSQSLEELGDGGVDMACHKDRTKTCPDSWECCNATKDDQIKRLKEMLIWVGNNHAWFEVPISQKKFNSLSSEEKELVIDVEVFYEKAQQEASKGSAGSP